MASGYVAFNVPVSRRDSLFLALIAFTLILASLDAQSTNTGVVAITAIDATTGAAVAGASISITGSALGQTRSPRDGAPSPVPLNYAVLNATTDAHGHGEFKELPAGTYTISGSAAGYLHASYGASAPQIRGIESELRAGGRLTLRLRLWKAATVSGTFKGLPGFPDVADCARATRHSQGWSDNYTGAGERTSMNRTLSGLVAAITISATTLSQPDDPGRPCANSPSRVTFAGTIRAPTEEPVVNARVRILRHRELRSAARLIPVSTPPLDVYSDDRGQYRASGLCPGTYALVALGPAGNLDATATPGGGARRAFVPTYFPGTDIAEQAGRIRLASGESMTNVDIRLQVAPAAPIAGRVISPEQTPAATAVTAVPISVPAPVRSMLAPTRTVPNQQGDFVLNALISGRYVVWTSTPESTSARPRSAVAEISVSGQPLNDVLLVLNDGASISGRVNWTAAGVRVLAVRQTDPSNVALVPQAPVGPDGTFVLRPIQPGRYRLSAVIPGSSGSTIAAGIVESATIAGRDVRDTAFDIDGQGTLTNAVVTVGQPTSLSGIVRDAAGRTVTGGVVLVVPANRAFWTAGSPRMRPPANITANGYSITNLPPGDYVLGVLPELDLEADDVSVLESIVSQGTKVTLGSGERKILDLTK